MASNHDHYCVCREVEQHPGDQRAALLKASMWDNGSEITVRFLEGTQQLQQRVQRVAKQWEQVANINFSFVDEGPANIRIAFAQGAGSWSYLGTQCRSIPADQPTMNYGWLTDESDDDEVRRVVLHEFGHALGLIHEHQNPKKPIQWNRAAVNADLGGPPNNLDDATIENNIFKKYAPGETDGTEVDIASIMMYPIPAARCLHAGIS